MPWYGWLIWGAVQAALIIWVSAAVRRVTGAAEKPEASGSEKLLALYRQIEEMLDSFEEFVGETHERLDERRA
ncbi:MAG: hypothetical protein FWH06_06950, partial [Oscillospiraceae bacterium]|nr:hypothetical protein [Oscillospiraceae bacterium]